LVRWQRGISKMSKTLAPADKTMRLSHPPHRMTPEGKRRVIRHLKEGCVCGAETATLTRRLILAAPNIHLQCDGCGCSISGSMKRADHPFWQSYNEWDQSKQDAGREIKETEFDRARRMREEAFQDQIRRYREEFLRGSEWASIRVKVLQRDGYICQACLGAEATQVHHDGYQHGVAPPMWLLKSICRPCHLRVTAGWKSDDGS
jgi:hypothetical protein